MAETLKTTKPANKTAKPAKKASAKKSAAPKAAPAPVAQPQAAPTVAREHLPIPDAKHVGLTTYDAKDPNTKYPPITTLRPPDGAPNMLIVLIDDVGFGASSAFGGPCNTPVAERLAANGLKLNRFHTTALCSPTRQAMLTGRNHHSVGMGAITEMATSAPGNSSIRPKEKAPIAETLEAQRLFDGSVRQVPRGAGLGGLPVPARSTSGPPVRVSSTSTGSSAARPTSTTPACSKAPRRSSRPSRPRRATRSPRIWPNRAITWVRQQKALMPDKPFFMYFAPGATHAPHHVPKEWSDKYKGKFDGGWDTLREKITRAAEEAWRSAEGRRTDDAARRDPELGRHAGGTQAGACAPDGDSMQAFSSRPTTKWGGVVDAIDDLGRPGRHADLLHHRRQRRFGRGHAERLLQRDDDAERHAGHRDHRVPAVQDRRFRHAQGVQPLRGRLGARAVRAISVDQAGGVALGRHPQRHDRALAQRIQGQGRVAQPVPPRHRRRADDPGGRRTARARCR